MDFDMLVVDKMNENICMTTIAFTTKGLGDVGLHDSKGLQWKEKDWKRWRKKQRNKLLRPNMKRNQ